MLTEGYARALAQHLSTNPLPFVLNTTRSSTSAQTDHFSMSTSSLAIQERRVLPYTSSDPMAGSIIKQQEKLLRWANENKATVCFLGPCQESESIDIASLPLDERPGLRFVRNECLAGEPRVLIVASLAVLGPPGEERDRLVRFFLSHPSAPALAVVNGYKEEDLLDFSPRETDPRERNLAIQRRLRRYDELCAHEATEGGRPISAAPPKPISGLRRAVVYLRAQPEYVEQTKRITQQVLDLHGIPVVDWFPVKLASISDDLHAFRAALTSVVSRGPGTLLVVPSPRALSIIVDVKKTRDDLRRIGCDLAFLDQATIPAEAPRGEVPSPGVTGPAGVTSQAGPTGPCGEQGIRPIAASSARWAAVHEQAIDKAVLGDGAWAWGKPSKSAQYAVSEVHEVSGANEGCTLTRAATGWWEATLLWSDREEKTKTTITTSGQTDLSAVRALSALARAGGMHAADLTLAQATRRYEAVERAMEDLSSASETHDQAVRANRSRLLADSRARKESHAREQGEHGAQPVTDGRPIRATKDQEGL